MLSAKDAAAAGDPPALERLLNASSLAGSAFGNVLESYDPAAKPALPEEARLTGGMKERLGALSAELGYGSPEALLDACAVN